MKKILLFSLVIWACFAAQKASAQKIKFGVRAGYNSAKWRGETAGALGDISDLTKNPEAISVSSKPGFFAGGYAQIPLAGRLVFEPGLYYSQKGTKISFTYPGEGVLKIIKLKGQIIDHQHYIDLPLQLKYFVSDNFYVYGGPQVSYLVSNEVEGRAGILGVSVGRKFDFDNAFRKWDFSVSGGVGFNFLDRMNLQVGYEHGLSRLDNTINADIYNRVIKAGLGFSF